MLARFGCGEVKYNRFKARKGELTARLKIPKDFLVVRLGFLRVLPELPVSRLKTKRLEWGRMKGLALGAPLFIGS